MRILKSILKYSAFFLLGVFTCALVGTTAISYYAISELTRPVAVEVKGKKPYPSAKASLTPSLAGSTEGPEAAASTPLNVNAKEVAKIAHTTMLELNKFDALMTELARKPLPPLCSTLCDPSYMDRERLSAERTDYLISYYKQEGSRALQDPAFRMQIAGLSFISRIFSKSLRSVLTDIDIAAKNPEVAENKLWMALRIETLALKEMTRLAMQSDVLKREATQLDKLRELHRSCNKGVARKQIVSECNSLLTN